MNDIITIETIASKIYLFRGVKVMLDRDLADLYNVDTSQLKRSVRRNIDRFPEDFMFELTKEELENWRCRFGTSNSVKMGLRYKPMAFTEQGVAMLSTTLRSKRAIWVNIEIMRTFVRLRQILATHKDLERKLLELEKKYDKQFNIVFEAIRQLMITENKPKKRIGFEVKEPKAPYGKIRKGSRENR